MKTANTTRIARRQKLFTGLDKLPSPPPGIDKPGNYRGLKIYACGSDTNYGRANGPERACQLESCSGTRLQVIWPDGQATWPCGKGLKPYQDGMRII